MVLYICIFTFTYLNNKYRLNTWVLNRATHRTKSTTHKDHELKYLFFLKSNFLDINNNISLLCNLFLPSKDYI